MNEINYTYEEAREHELAKLAHRILRLRELDDDEQRELCYALIAKSRARLVALLEE